MTRALAVVLGVLVWQSAAAVAVAGEPDAVSHASPAWKPGEKVVVDRYVDGAALRKRQRERLAADKSPVTLLTGESALSLGKRICEAVVPARPKDTPILLKPNMGGFDWFKNPKTAGGDDGVRGRITDPEFVRGVIQCLKARGHTHITVADGFTGEAKDWDRLIKVSGYAEMAKDEGVPLVAMDDDGVFDVQGTQPGKPLGVHGMEKTSVPTLLMPKLLAEHLQHGMYISLPKIKAHRYAVFSIGIKGQQGTAMYSDKAPAFHQRGRTHKEIDRALALVKKGDPSARAVYVKSLEIFAERMADILEVEAPDVVLAEGAPAMGGDGFQKLFPSAERMAVGGTNVVLVDRVGAEILGLWDNEALAKELGGHRTSPLLEVAAKHLGIDISAPVVVGDGAALLGKRRPAHLIGMARFVVDDTPVVGLHAARIADADAPKIDGAADAVWERAKAFEWSTDWAGNATSTKTRVRALWAPGTLYLRWELEGTDLITDRSRPVETERLNLYEEDCVEIMIAPSAKERERYYELEFGPYGHFYDVAVNLLPGSGKRFNDGWSATMRTAASQDAGRRSAVIEVAITAPEIVAALAPGAVLPVGLYRMNGKKPRQYLAAFPTRTAKPNFHVPAAFGELVIDPVVERP